MSCSVVHDFRSGELRKRNRFPSRKRTMIHFLVGACQTTLGSRLFAIMCGTTGLFAYFVQVRPRSLL